MINVIIQFIKRALTRLGRYTSVDKIMSECTTYRPTRYTGGCGVFKE